MTGSDAMEAQWIQFSRRPKRKRAELACALCHSKKIRCDLDLKRNQGHYGCTNCVSSGKPCYLRPSKRKGLSQISESFLSLNASLDSVGSHDHSASALPGNEESSIISSAIGPQLRDEFQNIESDSVNQPEVPAIHLRASGEHRPELSPESSKACGSSWKVSESIRPAYSGDNLGDNQILDDVHDSRQHMASDFHETKDTNTSQPELRPSFAETYLEYCYPWCPILDKSTLFDEISKSPLLEDALATLGSHLRPPLIPHTAPSTCYTRARRRFYDDEETDLLTSLKAVLLFYWWAPQAPSVLNRNSSWWWTSVVIRHAQQAGFHQDANSESSEDEINRGLQRRIWWTAFSRERLTAICQGKPCLIDPDDCNVPEPSLQDFPELDDKRPAEVFIYWVRLCSIIGRIAKELSQSSKSGSTIQTFQTDLAKELIAWIHSLPSHLQLPIQSNYTPVYDRAVHQLHLPYLAIIIVLHMTRSPQSLSLPQALPPATLAASCIARILKNVLMRTEIRFLMPITCWYSGMAFNALLQASKTEHLRDGANEDLEIIMLAVRQMKDMWGTAKVLDKGFERLRANDKSLDLEDFPNHHLGNERSTRALNSEEGAVSNGINWLDYFPFVTTETSAIAGKLLAQQDMDFFPWDFMDDPTMPQFQDVFEGLWNWGDATNLI